MNYLTLNAVFLAVVAMVLLITVIVMRRSFPWRAVGLTLAVLLMLTAIFDNVIIGVGIVAYDDSLLSGIRIGLAPIEDFAYTVAVVVIAPCVWILSERRAR